MGGCGVCEVGGGGFVWGVGVWFGLGVCGGCCVGWMRCVLSIGPIRYFELDCVFVFVLLYRFR